MTSPTIPVAIPTILAIAVGEEESDYYGTPCHSRHIKGLPIRLFIGVYMNVRGKKDQCTYICLISGETKIRSSSTKEEKLNIL